MLPLENDGNLADPALSNKPHPYTFPLHTFIHKARIPFPLPSHFLLDAPASSLRQLVFYQYDYGRCIPPLPNRRGASICSSRPCQAPDDSDETDSKSYSPLDLMLTP